MSRKIYIGNLPDAATENALSKLLSGHGSVARIKMGLDRGTGRSLGYAFVEMTTADDAARVIAALDGTLYQGWTLTVRTATPKRAA